jgi:replicative DNA helicase
MEDLPPFDAQAERVVLGCILLDAALYHDASAKLRVEDFFLASHRIIYERMGQLSAKGCSIDFVTLQQIMGQDEIFAVGGVSYITSLTDGLPRRLAVDEYAAIVAEKSMLRKVKQICAQAVAKADAQNESAEVLLNRTISALEDAVLTNTADADLESVGQWLDKNDVFAERKKGVETGITDYDELTFGMHAGELTVFAGRTSMGKTSFCGTIAWQMALRGRHVAVFLNEQQKASFIGRMLCGRSGVGFNNYRRGQLDWVERQYIEDAVKEFRTLGIYIDQRSSMSVGSIRAKAARLKRSGELDVILIDQHSRVNGEGIYVKGMRGDEVIGEKVSAIKGIAVDLDVPVGLFHQLNRDTTKNDEGRPTLSNLKNSGATEEHADNVALFHRPGYYKRDDTKKDEAEIIIAKQRDGETGTVHCEFVGYNCMWRNKGK